MQANTDSANVTYSYLAPLTYDAVWALALALHRVNKRTSIPSHSIEFDHKGLPCAYLRTMDNEKNLGDFDYSNSYLGCLIKQELRNSNFVGVSVRSELATTVATCNTINLYIRIDRL